jgi:hypothetical protein
MADVITVGLLFYSWERSDLLFRLELDDLFCAVGQLLETLGIHCP